MTCKVHLDDLMALIGEKESRLRTLSRTKTRQSTKFKKKPSKKFVYPIKKDETIVNSQKGSIFLEARELRKSLCGKVASNLPGYTIY